ncbi:MAG: hypothetical protein P1P84_15365 [Deferrisomatales bacterium]|nr:hypothetical protein [Deferrisomatales bacterium]
MTQDSVRHHQLNLRLDDRTHGQLTRRAQAAGLPVSTLAHDLVVHGLDHPVGLGPELFRRIEAIHGFTSEAARHLESVAVLPEKVEAVHAWTVGSRRSLEAADSRKLLRRLYPWIVRTVVYLNGLADISLPDNSEYERFQKKADQTTRDLLDEVLGALDAER